MRHGLSFATVPLYNWHLRCKENAMPQRKSLTKLYDNWLAERGLTAVADNHHQQQRRASRIFVKLPAWITLDSHPREHVAFVRDISTRGIFLYSDFLPRAGYHLNFILQYLNGSNNIRLHLGGKVVRLEQAQASAVVIAVAFDAVNEDFPQLVRSRRSW
jgi:hypothetical protein